MIPNLTKEEAVQEHRRMWNWIAEQYEHGNMEAVSYLKARYLEQYEHGKWSHIDHDCFCCEYDSKNRVNENNCSYCPIQWESNVSEYMCCDRFECADNEGLYCCIEEISYQTGNREKLAKLARKIANLPARE